MINSILSLINSFRYKPTRDMAGLTVVVFGASGKIGSVITNYFVDKGANIALFGRDINKLSRVVVDKSKNERIFTHAGDICDEIELNKFLNLTIKKFVKIDAVVNTVGLFNQKLISEVNGSDIDSMYNSNFKSVAIPSAVALKVLKSGSTIINFGSYITKNKNVGHGKSLYLSFKLAVEGFCRVLADEAKAKGVRVVCLEPATISNFVTKDFLKYINPYTIAEMIEFILRFKNVDFGVVPFKSVDQKI